MIFGVFLSFAGCKKEKTPETEQEKFERTMLAAGFKPIDEADVPKGITPYELSIKEIRAFVDNPKAREDSLKSIYQSNQKLLKSNTKVVLFETMEEDDPSFGTKVFMGDGQTYYFNNVSVNVSLTFNKQKAGGGAWKWVEASHSVSAQKVSNDGASDRNYYEEYSHTATFDGASCSGSSHGYLYYKGFGQTYQKDFLIGFSNGSFGSNGTTLILTF